MFTKWDVLHTVAKFADEKAESEGMHDTDISIQRATVANDLFIGSPPDIFKRWVADQLRKLQNDGFVILDRKTVRLTADGHLTAWDQ